MEVWLLSFITSALDEGGQHQAPVDLFPSKGPRCKINSNCVGSRAGLSILEGR